MKLGMNMIREYADIPVSPKEYESKMIMSGTAVEGVEDVADGMDKVVVGRVLTCEDVEGDPSAPVHGGCGRRGAAAHRVRRAQREGGRTGARGAGRLSPARRREDQEGQAAGHGLRGHALLRPRN